MTSDVSIPLSHPVSYGSFTLAIYSLYHESFQVQLLAFLYHKSGLSKSWLNCVYDIFNMECSYFNFIMNLTFRFTCIYSAAPPPPPPPPPPPQKKKKKKTFKVLFKSNAFHSTLLKIPWVIVVWCELEELFSSCSEFKIRSWKFKFEVMTKFYQT